MSAKPSTSRFEMTNSFLKLIEFRWRQILSVKNSVQKSTMNMWAYLVFEKEEQFGVVLLPVHSQDMKMSAQFFHFKII